jgi:hypothetical protein
MFPPPDKVCLHIEIRSGSSSGARPRLVRVEATPMDRFLWESQVEAHFPVPFWHKSMDALDEVKERA